MLTLTMLAALTPAPEADEFSLRWQAPQQCPREHEVRAAIEQQLGRAIEPPLGDGLRVELDAAAQDDGRWRIELRIAGPDGTARRELDDASDCAAAVQAAALVVAIAIDPQLVFAVPDPPQPVTTATEPATTTATPADDDAPTTTTTTTTDDNDGDAAVPATPRTRGRTRAVLGLAPAISVGDLPAPGGHGRVWLGLAQPRWRVEVGGSVGGGPTRSSGAARIAFLRWTAQLRACPVFRPGAGARLELLACAGIDAGQTRVRVRSLPSTPSADRSPDPWIAPVVAGALVWLPRPALGVRVGVELGVPAIRRSYQILGAPAVFATAPVFGAAFVGVEGRFP